MHWLGKIPTPCVPLPKKIFPHKGCKVSRTSVVLSDRKALVVCAHKGLQNLFRPKDPCTRGHIAQWLERTPDKREVGGSTPPRPTRPLRGLESLIGAQAPPNASAFLAIRRISGDGR